MQCHRCGHPYESKGKIRRLDECKQCSAYLHCCLNCRFYDKVAYHQCRETQSEWVGDKASANFCDYFEPRQSDDSASSSRTDEARRKLDDLFKS